MAAGPSDVVLDANEAGASEILKNFKEIIEGYYDQGNDHKRWYPMFSSYLRHRHRPNPRKEFAWVKCNMKQFLEDTPNKYLQHRWFSSECGYITSLTFSRDGEKIIVGHANGLIQMRHGHSGTVLATLRNIQYPPKPIYTLEFSRTEDRVCYAACADGAVYRIEIPFIDTSTQNGENLCIRIDPTLEWLNTQYFCSPGISVNATPFITQRSAVLSFGITADSTKMILGCADTAVKVFDMQTQELLQNFKVHKLRLQFIPKKLQRCHYGQICALRCHNDNPSIYASAAWDSTLRIWDIRSKVGCMMTFEGVNVCHDSIDLNREQAITGSWQPTEALCTWDLTAKKRLNIIRVQNRRPDVDGEYIYACRYWKSSMFNRKGKYAIIGGSGTGCVEVINLHNRYISCSYPAPGTILAVASHEERIAFGGTSPVFNIVTFHDPKHEKYKLDEEPPYDYSLHPVTLFERIISPPHSDEERAPAEGEEEEDEGHRIKGATSKLSDISKVKMKISKISTVHMTKPPQKSQ